MLDKHIWHDEDGDAYEAVGYQVRTAGGEEVGEGVAGREILRLAQRVQELEGLASEALSALAVIQPPAADAVRILAIRAQELYDQVLRPDAWRGAVERSLTARIQELEAALQREKVEGRETAHELSLRIRERDNALTELKAELAEVKDSDAERCARLGVRALKINALTERLAAEESKGRQYCEELAEKSQEIRQLKDRARALEIDLADARKVVEEPAPPMWATRLWDRVAVVEAARVLRAVAPTIRAEPAEENLHAAVIEKRRHERTGSEGPRFYAIGPVRETLHEAIADANLFNGWKA